MVKWFYCGEQIVQSENRYKSAQVQDSCFDVHFDRKWK